MSAKTCEVCGREVGHMSDEHMGTCGRKAQEGFGNPASACYRLGYEREKAAREAAEEGQGGGAAGPGPRGEGQALSRHTSARQIRHCHTQGSGVRQEKPWAQESLEQGP